MPGFGTVINVAAVILGGLLGLLLGKRLQKRFQESMINAIGVCVLFIGIAGAMEQMLIIRDGVLNSSKTMMLIGSMAIGTLVGELLDLEGALERFGNWLKRITKSEGDDGFVEAFVTASLTICIGAMAVVGSIQDSLLGDYSILMAKAVLDLLIIMMMAASKGKGVVFSAVPVAILQGSITALAFLLEPIFTETALSYMSLVGSVLIFCVGLNLIREKKVKVANMLPALVIAVLWAILFAHSDGV